MHRGELGIWKVRGSILNASAMTQLAIAEGGDDWNVVDSQVGPVMVVSLAGREVIALPVEIE